MTDAALADIRRILGNATAAGALRPRLVLHAEGAEVYAYLQADSEMPGATWETPRSAIPTAAAWPGVLDTIASGEYLASLVDEFPEDMEGTP